MKPKSIIITQEDEDLLKSFYFNFKDLLKEIKSFLNKEKSAFSVLSLNSDKRDAEVDDDSIQYNAVLTIWKKDSQSLNIPHSYELSQILSGKEYLHDNSFLKLLEQLKPEIGYQITPKMPLKNIVSEMSKTFLGSQNYFQKLHEEDMSREDIILKAKKLNKKLNQNKDKLNSSKIKI